MIETFIRTDAVSEAVQILRSGGLVALPTETVYGLAADALNPKAVAGIFEAKDRPFFDPLIVHVPAVEWLERITDVHEPLVDRLIEEYWPGPLTILLERKPAVPDIVTAGLSEVAVRMSAHPLFRAVCSEFGRPIAAPSANRFGKVSPTCANHVFTELQGRIPLILDGGGTQHGVESTILRVREGRIEILRAGPIAQEDLKERFGVEVSQVQQGAKPSAPGQLESHYAPGTPLLLVPEADCWDGMGNVGLLAWRAPANPGRFAAIEYLSPSGDLREAASRLFASMRRLDERELDLIVAEHVPEEGIGRAIMDRLRRASAKR